MENQTLYDIFITANAKYNELITFQEDINKKLDDYIVYYKSLMDLALKLDNENKGV